MATALVNRWLYWSSPVCVALARIDAAGKWFGLGSGGQRVDAGLQLVQVLDGNADARLRRDQGRAGLAVGLDELADVGVALATEFVDVRAHSRPRLLELVQDLIVLAYGALLNDAAIGPA